MYKRALAENDEAALAVACGDVDGRRDNRRVITRAEEAEALALIDKENVHPKQAGHTAHSDRSAPAARGISSPCSQYKDSGPWAVVNAEAERADCKSVGRCR